MVWEDDDDKDGRADESEMAWPAFMESVDAADLDGVPGAFTFHVSCDNGFPEEQENLGAALLSGGAAATATASRPAIGMTSAWGEAWEPRPDLATASDAAWYYAVLVSEGATAGEALAYTKYGLPGDGWADEYPGTDLTGYAWMSKVEYNLYGDPTRTLEACAGDGDCDDGSPCDGTETCRDGFCVHSAGPDCSALDDGCVVGACDDATGGCVAVPRTDGAACDDGAWCTEDDACEAGACAGAARDCGDREGWVASCDEQADACVFEPGDAGGGEAATGGCAAAPGPATALLALLAALPCRRRRGR
jgi:hypothetical protein